MSSRDGYGRVDEAAALFSMSLAAAVALLLSLAILFLGSRAGRSQSPLLHRLPGGPQDASKLESDGSAA